MTTTDFTTSILVDQPAKEVFNAINNVRGWWDGEIKGSSEKVGDEFSYRVKDAHYSKQKVVELIPNKKVVWLVTESSLGSYKNRAEWTSTKIMFELSETKGKTELHFTHEGLVPAFECYGGCAWAWGELIQESLLSLITTGKGTKVFA